MNEVTWWRTSVGEPEVQRLLASISGEYISQGPVTAEFEEAFAAALNVPYAVVTTSGSVALLMAAMALDIGPGDEVIVPNRTWIATAHAPLLLGAKVVLVDVKPDLPALDVSQIEEEITPRTKAIMPVHLNGRAVDMERLGKIAERHGLVVIEDACQALFSRNSAGFLGTQSDAGCFSLGVTKLITTGQGGVVVTRSEDTWHRLKLIRNNGVEDTYDPTYLQIGCNFKFTDMLASIGLAQLERATERVRRVGDVYSRYAAALEDIPYLEMIPVDLAAGEVPLYSEVLCRDRENLIAYLGSQGIEVRPFLPSLHLAPQLNSQPECPNSSLFNDHGIFMPAGPEQPFENIDRVIDALRRYPGGLKND